MNEIGLLKIKNTYFNSNLKVIYEFFIFKAATPQNIMEPDGTSTSWYIQKSHV